MQIQSLDDVRPGDIMVSGMSTAPTKVLVYGGQLLLHEYFRVGKFIAGHAGVVSAPGRLVEAMPSGARERGLRESDWSPKHVYFRLPEQYPGQALDAAAAARTMIGTPYSFASYAYLGLYLGGYRPEWLAHRIDRRRYHDNQFVLPSGIYAAVEPPVEAICSVLAEQAWTMTGMKVIRGTRPQVVTPGMLAKQLWRRPGVIRGIAMS